jgi:hypothetical protein
MGANLVYLDRPSTLKTTEVGQAKMGYQYAASSMQGWRLSMEDAHIINENIDGQNTGLFAVFDGHGGIEIAKFCELHFVDCLVSSELYKSKDYPKALEETFLKMDDLIRQSKEELMQIHLQFPPKMTPLKRASQMQGMKNNKELKALMREELKE